MLSTTERINKVEEEKVTAEGEISNADSGTATGEIEQKDETLDATVEEASVLSQIKHMRKQNMCCASAVQHCY